MFDISCWEKNDVIENKYWWTAPEPVCWQVVYGCSALTSDIFALLIPTLYITSKRCRHHPASIILVLCLLEMVSSYQLLMGRAILYDAITWFVETQLKYFSWYEDVRMNVFFQIVTRNYAMYLACMIAQICYFTTLCVDLIVTVKMPFKNSSSRIILYHSIVVLATTIIFTTVIDQDEDLLLITIYLLFCIFFFSALISLFYGLIHLSKSNSSNHQTKNKYLINHMLMILAMLGIWTPLNVIEFYTVFNIQNDFSSYLTDGDPFLCLLLATPIIFALIRMREPYFYFRIQFLYRNITGKNPQSDRTILRSIEKIDDKNQDQWLIPLNQLFQNNQNCETVSHILISILEIVGQTSKLEMQVTLNYLKSQSRQTKTINRAKNESIGENHINDSISDLKSSFIKSDFDNNGYDSEEYRIIQYAPGIFQRLREIDGITDEQMFKSLDHKLNLEQIQKSQESLGKSGSFFFFSHDRRLILKTLQYSELQTLVHTLLPHYSFYILNNNPTLMAKIYGAYTVNIGGLSSVHLVLMEDTTSYIPPLDSRSYDLKGSIINRYIDTENEAIRLSSHTSSIIPQDIKIQQDQLLSSIKVLKDVNFIESKDLFLELDPSIRAQLIKVMEADSNLLKSLNIMDYSLFLCISDSQKAESNKNIILKNQFRRIRTDNKIISISVIDILQSYNLNKWLEYQFKALNTKNPHLISCLDAEHYRSRFLAFMNSIFISTKTYN